MDHDNKYYLHSDIATKILTAMSRNQDAVAVSLDLNKSTVVLPVLAGQVRIDRKDLLTKSDLLCIQRKKNRIFILEDKVLRVMEYRNRHYYKLVPTQDAPTVEIDGIKMHRSKGITPFTDAEQKAKEVVRAGHRVLDTCGGLGYTAIWALRLGARAVVSIECDKHIQKLRSENPWSSELFNEKIKLVSADVTQFINTLESGSFDSILHDPPRFSLAGELYSEPFYCDLWRVLANRGALFHYTGNPYIVRRGRGFPLKIAKRLRDAGFGVVVRKQNVMGVKAVK
jgi:predicted methyltransferase